MNFGGPLLRTSLEAPRSPLEPVFYQLAVARGLLGWHKYRRSNLGLRNDKDFRLTTNGLASVFLRSWCLYDGFELFFAL